MFNKFIKVGVPTLIDNLGLLVLLSQKNIPNTFKSGGIK